MVRLSKIYTKVGDAGQTMLGDGRMVSKRSLRVEAYGAVDEANAAIGVAAAALEAAATAAAHEVLAELTLAQNELFDVGADLCVPLGPDEPEGAKLRIEAAQVARLERVIDGLNAPLKPLDSFVLPGGAPGAAALHVARTVVRRAERVVAGLVEAEGEQTNVLCMVYLNRLSDLLFVMARVINAAGGGGSGDVLWQPGATRGNNGE